MYNLGEPIHEHHDTVAPSRVARGPNTKFMLTDFQVLVGIGIGRSGDCDDGDGFTYWQISHERTHLRTHL